MSLKPLANSKILIIVVITVIEMEKENPSTEPIKSLATPRRFRRCKAAMFARM